MLPLLSPLSSGDELAGWLAGWFAAAQANLIFLQPATRSLTHSLAARPCRKSSRPARSCLVTDPECAGLPLASLCLEPLKRRQVFILRQPPQMGIGG